MAAATDTAGRERYAANIAVSAGDLLLATAYAAVAAAAIYLGAVTGPLRVFVAAPLLGFVPGYAVVSALFPARRAAHDGTAAPTRGRGAGLLERCSLAVGTSLVVLVLVAVLFPVADVPFRVGALSAAVVAVTAVGSVGGTLRRYRLPPDVRFVVPVSRLASDLRAGTVEAKPLDAAVNVALAVGVLVAASTLAVGFAASPGGGGHTEAALLTDDGDRLVAGNYTAVVERGERATVTLAVENDRSEAAEYTAVVVLERVDAADGDSVVVERAELDRVRVSADAGETATRELSVAPSMLGDDLRLNVFLYDGDAPETATGETAPHHLYLWLDVERADGSTERVAGDVGASSASPLAGPADTAAKSGTALPAASAAAGA